MGPQQEFLDSYTHWVDCSTNHAWKGLLRYQRWSYHIWLWSGQHSVFLDRSRTQYLMPHCFWRKRRGWSPFLCLGNYPLRRLRYPCNIGGLVGHVSACSSLWMLFGLRMEWWCRFNLVWGLRWRRQIPLVPRFLFPFCSKMMFLMLISPHCWQNERRTWAFQAEAMGTWSLQESYLISKYHFKEILHRKSMMGNYSNLDASYTRLITWLV